MTSRLQEVVARVVRNANDPYPEDSLDLIYYEFDTAFSQGRFGEADEVLSMLDPKTLGQIVLMLAVLSITKAAADKLPSRAGYSARVWEALAGEPEPRRTRLMEGIA